MAKPDVDPFSKFRIDCSWSSIPLTAQKMRAVLDAYRPKPKPSDNGCKYFLMGSQQLAGAVGVSIQWMHHFSQHPSLILYKTTARRGRSTLWGNKKTVLEYDKLKKAEREAELEH